MVKKPWYQSKTILFNAIYTVIEIAAFALNLVPEKYTPICVSIQGIGTIIIRIWFSETGISLKQDKLENSPEESKPSEETEE